MAPLLNYSLGIYPFSLCGLKLNEERFDIISSLTLFSCEFMRCLDIDASLIM